MKRRSLAPFLPLAVAALTVPVFAQLSYPEPGAVILETFDAGLPGAAITDTWTNNGTFPGWYAWQTGGTGSATSPDPAGVPAQWRRTDGIQAPIRFYQWRAGPSAADGAFGSHASDSSGDLIRAVRITNDAGKVLKSFTLSYTGEQWRTSNTGAQQTITVAYLVGTPPGDPPNLASGSWSEIPALTFVSPTVGDGSGTSANINGSAPENSTEIAAVTVNATWNPGTDLWIRFYDDNSSGVDHGLAIDDVRFTASEEGDSSGLILWAWSGGVTGTSARVVAKVTAGAEAELLVTPEGGNTASYPMGERIPSTGGDLLHFEITGLTPDTAYSYRVRSGNNLGEVGNFRTFPVGPASFDFLFASCANTGSSSAVFTTMMSHGALFFYHMGDMNYENTNTTNVFSYHQNYDRILASPTQRALYRSLPITYTWDDHDFAGNDSDTNSTGKTAARLAYDANIPHYPFGIATRPGPIGQAFSAGRVRFILLDTRSERNAPTTKIGAAQLDWLKAELLAARDTHPVIVLGLGVPWVASSSGDRWGEVPNERAEIANWIKSNNITGVIGIHGDAHMLAYDDGRNNNYATGGGPNFPTFNAAAMDRGGSTKGGPFSGGTLPESGQYGLMSIVDDGGTSIQIRFSGRRHGAGEMMSYEFSVPAPAYTPRVATWRQSVFGTEDPAGDAANDADPDGDGLPNLAEYAFGLDPQARSDEGRPSVSVVMVDGEPHLAFSHRQRTDDPTLRYVIEGSIDLVTWTTVLFPPHGSPTAVDGNTETVTRLDPEPYGASEYRFLRLRIIP